MSPIAAPQSTSLGWVLLLPLFRGSTRLEGKPQGGERFAGCWATPPSLTLEQILESTGSSSQGRKKLVPGKYLPGVQARAALTLLTPGHGRRPRHLAAAPSWVSLCPPAPCARLGVPQGPAVRGQSLAPWILPFAGTTRTTPLGKSSRTSPTAVRHHRVTCKDPAASPGPHPARPPALQPPKFPFIEVLWGNFEKFQGGTTSLETALK